MAARAKRQSRPTKRFVDEIEQLKPCAMKKRQKKDSNLDDMEVTEDDKEKISIKIHFVCYGNEFDEWREFDIDSDQFFRVEIKISMFQTSNR